MNPHSRFVAVLNRIASATSIMRTRADAVTRTERNGGTAAEQTARVEQAVIRLEHVADELEAALR